MSTGRSAKNQTHLRAIKYAPRLRTIHLMGQDRCRRAEPEGEGCVRVTHARLRVLRGRFGEPRRAPCRLGRRLQCCPRRAHEAAAAVMRLQRTD
eukprot:scaffold4240_cov73-Phaeocystis_antarctica.AAC.6